MGKDSRILRRESTQTSGDPQIDKDVKEQRRGEKVREDGRRRQMVLCRLAQCVG